MNTDPSQAGAVPVLDGWFTLNRERPQLLGNRCATCGTYYFPKLKSGYCRNPDCDGEAFDETPLSRTGTLWSFTNASYKPPATFAQVATAAFVPFLIPTVELETETMNVPGPVVNVIDFERSE